MEIYLNCRLKPSNDCMFNLIYKNECVGYFLFSEDIRCCYFFLTRRKFKNPLKELVKSKKFLDYFNVIKLMKKKGFDPQILLPSTFVSAELYYTDSYWRLTNYWQKCWGFSNRTDKFYFSLYGNTRTGTYFPLGYQYIRMSNPNHSKRGYKWQNNQIVSFKIKGTLLYIDSFKLEQSFFFIGLKMCNYKYYDRNVLGIIFSFCV